MDYSTIAASDIKLLSLLPSVWHSDHFASIETIEKRIYWMSSLWRSFCVSITLFLDYFYSYSSNASLKIKPVLLLYMFSAEHSVTVVLSLRSTNLTWIELDFHMDPVFPPHCHLGVLRHEVPAAQPLSSPWRNISGL